MICATRCFSRIFQQNRASWWHHCCRPTPPPDPAAELASTREGRAVEKAKAEDANVCEHATAYAQSVSSRVSCTR